MKMKIGAGLAFLFNAFLFGTYYAVSKEALERIDPIVFMFFVMIALVPVGVCILALSWPHTSKEAVKSGALLGSCLCLGLFTLTVALKQNSATSTAFFPSLNGLLAAVFTWLFLRQPISKFTWVAGGVSVVGAVLLIANSPMGGARGALIAFIGGLFCTFYVFLADHEQRDKAAYWPLLGAELLTMAAWACLIALLFGDWEAVHPSLPKDIGIILYIALGTTLLPTLITVLLQKYISPVTVSFIYILEPILGAIFAYAYLKETMPMYGYVGGGMVVVGAVINTWGTARAPSDRPLLQRRLVLTGQQLHRSLWGTLVLPFACCCVGIFLVYKIGGLPPVAWGELYHRLPHLSLLLQQKAGWLLVAQAVSWLMAWISLIIIGGVTLYRAITQVFFKPKTLSLDHWDVRVLRQMGVTPQALSSARKRTDNQLVQRRLRERRERLTQIEFVE